MSMVVARKRSAIRRAIKIPCRVVREADFQLLGTQTLDLSQDGMLLPTEMGVEICDECIVSFKATPLDIWFDTVATVSRVVEGRRPTARPRSVGLSFRTLDSVHRLILRGALRKVPPPLPAREQRIDYAATIFKIAYG
jgi:PilZ domain